MYIDMLWLILGLFLNKHSVDLILNLKFNDEHPEENYLSKRENQIE